MENQEMMITDRLMIRPLTTGDDAFILELVNTEGWLRFIGDRKVDSIDASRSYIQKILDSSNVSYWVVSIRDTSEKAGIITYIKRDYLDYPDIGFAFLPSAGKKGYAYEATCAVLRQLIPEQKLSRILAITVPENAASIGLLEKTGLTFEKEIEDGGGKLLVYGAYTGELTLE